MQSPVAYVVVSHPHQRARIVEGLRQRGWQVVERPTGFHVLAELADVIEGKTTELPAKIVIDADARGCTGRSIAAGLHAIGVNIPVELVHEPRPGPAQAALCSAV